jgi:hypothetical protein
VAAAWTLLLCAQQDQVHGLYHSKVSQRQYLGVWEILSTPLFFSLCLHNADFFVKANCLPSRDSLAYMALSVSLPVWIAERK